MKVMASEISHKSDVGGVLLGIRDEAEVRHGFTSMQEVAREKDFRGVILYPVIRGAVEALVGISCDPQFGPVIAFGLGGIHTEILNDIALRVAPLDRAQALAMIAEIKAFPVLQGVRGEQPRDIEAIADLLVAVSRLPFLYPDLEELDLNPVFLLPQGLVVGDARAVGRTPRVSGALE
jgi:acyl-CoA synthetase (NDP forming)